MRRSLLSAVMLLLVASLAACEQPAARNPGTATATSGDDTRITSAVKARLAEERVSTLAQIDVATRAGVVELSGAVDSTALKDRAAELAKGVSGVREVTNNLRVRPFGS